MPGLHKVMNMPQYSLKHCLNSPKVTVHLEHTEAYSEPSQIFKAEHF